jgi:hypothetical protein
MNSLGAGWHAELHGDAAGANAILVTKPPGSDDLVPTWARDAAVQSSRDSYRAQERANAGWGTGGIADPGGPYAPEGTRRRGWKAGQPTPNNNNNNANNSNAAAQPKPKAKAKGKAKAVPKG